MYSLEQCQAGDEQAWRGFLGDHTSQVFRWCVFLGLDGADAEEVTQEIFATAVRHIRKCKNKAVVPSWLYQITRRLVANRRRSAWKRRVQSQEGPLLGAFEHDEGEGLELELAVRSCLRELGEKHSEVLLLMSIEGFTRREVADMLGIAEGTVASRHRQARIAFKELWSKNQECDEFFGEAG